MASHFASLSILLPQNSNSVKYSRKDVKLAHQTSLPKSAITPKAIFPLQSFCTHYVTLPPSLHDQYQHQSLKKPCLGCKVNFTLCLPDPTVTHQVKKDTHAHKHPAGCTQTRTCPSFFREKRISYTANNHHLKTKCITQHNKRNKSYSPSPIAIQMVQGALSNQEVKYHSKISVAQCLRHWARPAAYRHREHCVTQAALQLCTAIANSCYSTSK